MQNFQCVYFDSEKKIFYCWIKLQFRLLTLRSLRAYGLKYTICRHGDFSFDNSFRITDHTGFYLSNKDDWILKFS